MVFVVVVPNKYIPNYGLTCGLKLTFQNCKLTG